MSLRFCDSFDHYDTAHITAKWTTFPGGPTGAAISTSSQRNGRACMNVTGGGVSKTIDNIVTWIIGGAFNWDAFGGGITLFNVNFWQVGWTLQADGTILVQNNNGSLGQTSPANAITLNKYYYVEMKTTLNSTTGSVIIKINGQTVLTLTNVNTSTNAVNQADVMTIGGPGGGAFMHMDDLYVCDGAGSFNKDFLGDVLIGVIKPISDGTNTQWTPTGTSTTTHFADVNDIPPDDDTSYVLTTGTNNIDEYFFETVGTTRIVLGVQSNIFARKDDEGNRALSVFSRNPGAPGTNVADTSGRFVNLSYIDYLNQFDVEPVSGGTWTPTIINTYAWGVKLIV
jgi:hypothetical protein